MHFYGYKYEEVLSLSADTFNHLLRCMIKVEAMKRIEGFQVSSFPHLKEAEAKKVHKRAYSEAETDDQRGKNVISLGDIKRVLNG